MQWTTLNPKVGDFSDLLQFSAVTHTSSWTATKWLEIDQANMQTGTDIGYRASHKHKLKLLVTYVILLYSVICILHVYNFNITSK